MEAVGKFEFSRKDLIGHGAFAVVFKGRHREKHDLEVAVKCINKKNLAKSQTLLGKEIKILKELKHENVVALYDFQEMANSVYLVMEYCNGGDLADYLHTMRTLSEDTIRLFLRQMAGAMRLLHSRGIIHRDLKPQNILLTSPGGRRASPNTIRVKIADFGFARYLQSNTMAATLCGSPMYMAPEVIMSQHYDGKADLWSIGTIVYQCLTGKAPFQASSPQDLRLYYEKNKMLVPTIPRETSAPLRQLLLSLLQRNPKDRMDFDEFFHHPFLDASSSVKKSPPVPVPSYPSSGSGSSSSSSSTSHLASPPSLGDTPQQLQKTLTCPADAAGFLHGSGDSGSSKGSSCDTDDFVMVPAQFPGDLVAEAAGAKPLPDSLMCSGSSLVGSMGLESRGRTPSPSPPCSSSPSPSRYGGSVPIPVPTQVQNYQRIEQNLQAPGHCQATRSTAIHRSGSSSPLGLARASVSPPSPAEHGALTRKFSLGGGRPYTPCPQGEPTRWGPGPPREPITGGRGRSPVWLVTLLRPFPQVGTIPERPGSSGAPSPQGAETRGGKIPRPGRCALGPSAWPVCGLAGRGPADLPGLGSAVFLCSSSFLKNNKTDCESRLPVLKPHPVCCRAVHPRQVSAAARGGSARKGCVLGGRGPGHCCSWQGGACSSGCGGCPDVSPVPGSSVPEHSPRTTVLGCRLHSAPNLSDLHVVRSQLPKPPTDPLGATFGPLQASPPQLPPGLPACRPLRSSPRLPDLLQRKPLPPILGSPTKAVPSFDFPKAPSSQNLLALLARQGVVVAPPRNRTLPDLSEMAPFQAPQLGPGLRPTEEAKGPFGRSLSTGRLTDLLLKAAFGPQAPDSGSTDSLQERPMEIAPSAGFGGTLQPGVRAGGSGSPSPVVFTVGSPPSGAPPPQAPRPRIFSVGSSGSLGSAGSSSGRHLMPGPCSEGAATELSAPGHCCSLADTMAAQLEGAVTFEAPDLPEETLMEQEHTDILHSLRFTLLFVQHVLEIAALKGRASEVAGAPEYPLQESVVADQISQLSREWSFAEQLVLYLKVAELLSSGLQTAIDQIRAGKLCLSSTVKQVVRKLNELYKASVVSCQGLSLRLQRFFLDKQRLMDRVHSITAEKLIFNHAVQMVQSAALDEMFRHREDCVQRYHQALLLLEGLQQILVDQPDVENIARCKLCIERRLSALLTGICA
ncbi:serine/threonine-protein kinase ULK1 isoform X2 [Choloepus didactylus]|uniref:serine/threonine-protein kinase ULK1 isoform X2 n=1 Tax=Choloepus didactylus TaxID=27675 RepID=UPI0018A00AF4|nr:serine/threonine-protein kinase ULK1 isoform X2 [Choloepus didactylus]